MGYTRDNKHALRYEDHKTTLYCDDFLRTRKIPLKSVDLIVTSPPYNIGIDYAGYQDNKPYATYLEFMQEWLAKSISLARPGGRLCMNIPLNTNKNGPRPVCADVTTIAIGMGWRYQTTIIWNEGNILRRTAWGSWLSASAPTVIAPVEVVVVMSKGDWKRAQTGESDITKDEFIAWTNGLWTFSGQPKKGAGGHPAAFPVELPRRCIKMFSYVGDTVLDPFAGSGTTLLAAADCGRFGVGMDIDETYCNIARNRIRANNAVLEGF